MVDDHEARPARPEEAACPLPPDRVRTVSGTRSARSERGSNKGCGYLVIQWLELRNLEKQLGIGGQGISDLGKLVPSESHFRRALTVQESPVDLRGELYRKRCRVGRDELREYLRVLVRECRSRTHREDDCSHAAGFTRHCWTRTQSEEAGVIPHQQWERQSTEGRRNGPPASQLTPSLRDFLHRASKSRASPNLATGTPYGTATAVPGCSRDPPRARHHPGATGHPPRGSDCCRFRFPTRGYLAQCLPGDPGLPSRCRSRPVRWSCYHPAAPGRDPPTGPPARSRCLLPNNDNGTLPSAAARKRRFTGSGSIAPRQPHRLRLGRSTRHLPSPLVSRGTVREQSG